MPGLSRRCFLAGTAGFLAGTACSTSDRGATAALPRFDRERFVEDVKRALPDGQGAVDEVIARAVSQPGAVLREFGAPVQRSADLLYHDADLTIFNIVMPPNATVGPHDHLMWASIGVYAGREDNIMWRPRNDMIEEIVTETAGTGEVFSLPHDAIHSMVNPGESHTAAIHVYGGDLFGVTGSRWDPVTRRKVTD